MTHILEQILILEQIEPHLYRSTQHLQSFREWVFGGQVIGQALVAAQRSCPDKTIHSLHAYFLTAANNQSPLDYHIDIRRRGRSFESIDVQVVQNDHLVFTMSASFHHKESGYAHEHPPRELPIHLLDDSVPLVDDQHIKVEPQLMGAISPFAIKAVEGNIFSNKKQTTSNTSFWLKPRIAIEDTPLTQAATLAFASDLGLLASALLRHPISLFGGDVFAASLDHAIWFHNIEALNFNDWLLYSIDSPWAGNARGFSRGEFYTPEGKLIASTCQEGLIRPKNKVF